MGIFRWLADIQRGFEDDWKYEENIQLESVIRRSLDTALHTVQFHIRVTLGDEAQSSINIIQAMRNDLRELSLEAWKHRWYRADEQTSL